MKASAEKSSSSAAKTGFHAANRPFLGKADGPGFFAPAVQMKMTVNQPGDKFEQEADLMAAKVMRMPTPDQKLQKQDDKLQKAEAPNETIQKQSEETLQKDTAPEERVQKAQMPEQKLPKQEAEDKLQKADEDRLQKAETPDEKLQKTPAAEDKLQKAEAPDEQIQKAEAPEQQLQNKEDDKLQRKGDGAPSVGASMQSTIDSKTTGGQALSSDVRGFMEPRIGADFSTVRVHTDQESASISNQLSARAFTYKNHIFFSRDQYQPGTGEGKQLLAHELTHTVQQGASLQRSPKLSTTPAAPAIQRLGISDALDYFADKAYYIPGFRMLTILLGFNPINRSPTDRSAANILRAMIEFIPGGHLITQVLDNHGVFTQIAAWVEQQVALLGDIGGGIVAGLKAFLDGLSWRDIFDLSGVWERAQSIFTNPIGRLVAFAKGLAVTILKMVKDAILKPLAALAKGTAGYDLLCAVLGYDVISGEPVPRNADTLIGGFMTLIGQQEIWENLKQGNAVARAWAWFQGALLGLMTRVMAIPGKIVATLKSLTFSDIITVTGAFAKIAGAYLSTAGEFISWGFGQVLSLLEILFSVVAPAVMPYLKKAKGAFTSILKNPIGFVGNLVSAGKLGFQQFAAHILTHLKTALIKWIVGPLGDAGVYIPQAFSLVEIVKLVLSVLGLTWQNIRTKLVKLIPEPVLAGLEKTAAILVTLVKEGPAAAWEQIKAELSELKDQLIAQVTQMISTEIVKAAVVKLVSMLSPAGAVIQAIIATYNTITFFVQKLRQIGAVVASFVDSIAAIAAGQVAGAAKRVEETMANTLTVVLAFLAKFAGLGNIPEKLVGIIKKIRQPIDRGLDKIVVWVATQARQLARSIAQAGLPQDPAQRLELGMQAAVSVINRFAGKRVGAVVLNPLLAVIKVRYGFRNLNVSAERDQWFVEGEINPRKRKPTKALTGSAATSSSFDFKIDGVGSINPEQPLMIKKGGRLATPPPADKFKYAYIGNTPATLKSSPSVIAQRYRTAFPNAGKVVPEEADMRFSLVIGMNIFEDLEGENKQKIKDKVETGAGVAYPWSIIGFLWQPQWKNKDNAKVTMELVRRSLNDPVPQKAADNKEAAQKHEKNINSSHVPYGPVRDIIFKSDDTENFKSALNARASKVFVHVSDEDTVNFNPPADDGGNIQALFQRFDDILDGVNANIQQHAGRGAGSSPIIIAGGYEFQLQLDPSQQIIGQTQDLRVRLSARLDMAVRRAMASVDPKSVYFPEPNLLIELTPETIEASFGTGRLESRRVIKSIDNPNLVFDTRAALATSAERFGIKGTQVLTSWGELKQLTEADLRAMINSSQSHAQQRNWAHQVRAAYGLNNKAIKPLFDLWKEFFPISDDLCGFDPARLKAGVTNRQFTHYPKYAKNDEVRSDLENALDSRGRTETDNKELASRLISLAEAAGLGLADELAAMFQQISNS